MPRESNIKVPDFYTFVVLVYFTYGIDRRYGKKLTRDSQKEEEFSDLLASRVS